MGRYEIALDKQPKRVLNLNHFKQQAQTVISSWPKWKRQGAGKEETAPIKRK